MKSEKKRSLRGEQGIRELTATEVFATYRLIWEVMLVVKKCGAHTLVEHITKSFLLPSDDLKLKQSILFFIISSSPQILRLFIERLSR